jgi:hypothetical protein
MQLERAAWADSVVGSISDLLHGIRSIHDGDGSCGNGGGGIVLGSSGDGWDSDNGVVSTARRQMGHANHLRHRHRRLHRPPTRCRRPT